MYKRILSEMQAPIQTYDKHSRLGAPIYEVEEHKLLKLMPFFERLLAGDLSLFDLPDIYVINNIRLQAEPKAKEREFIFVGAGGVPYLKKIGAAERFDSVFERTASRQRLVFNYPVANLLTQVLDTAIHNWFLRSPAIHINMASMIGKTLPGYVRFIDVKHWERGVGAIVRHRHRHIGGLFERIVSRLLEVPYLVPGDDGMVYSMRVNHDKGYIEQLGSGISAVAPIGKEIFILLYAVFFMRLLNVSFDNALTTAMAGGTDKLHFMNYGDDNVLYGDPDLVERCLEFLRRVLTIEIEEPPRFLGHYYDEKRGFHLGASSYVLNMYLAERGPRTRFRPYPFLGFQLRRELFSRMGHESIRNEIIPKEDEYIAQFGFTLSRMVEMARKEKESIMTEGLEVNPLSILEKEYMLTDEQKMLDPNFDVLSREVTRSMIATLLK